MKISILLKKCWTCAIKGTTTGKDIYEFVNLSLDKFNIDRKTFI